MTLQREQLATEQDGAATFVSELWKFPGEYSSQSWWSRNWSRRVSEPESVRLFLCRACLFCTAIGWKIPQNETYLKESNQLADKTFRHRGPVAKNMVDAVIPAIPGSARSDSVVRSIAHRLMGRLDSRAVAPNPSILDCLSPLLPVT